MKPSLSWVISHQQPKIYWDSLSLLIAQRQASQFSFESLKGLKIWLWTNSSTPKVRKSSRAPDVRGNDRPVIPGFSQRCSAALKTTLVHLRPSWSALSEECATFRRAQIVAKRTSAVRSVCIYKKNKKSTNMSFPYMEKTMLYFLDSVSRDRLSS